MAQEAWTESDWKLFRSRIGGWQEAYIKSLNASYIELLESEGLPSEKFWELEKRLCNDRYNAGVIVEMRRSRLMANLVDLLEEGVIGVDDLDGFSNGLKEALGMSVSKIEL